MKKHITLLVSLLVIVALIPPYAAAAPISISTVGYKALETTTYKTIYMWDTTAEMTGNLGAMMYSWGLDAYLVVFVNETDTQHHEGPLYAYIVNASGGYEQALVLESSAIVYGVDTVVAGWKSFLVGYTAYGSAKDAYVAIITWSGTSYTYTTVPLGTSSDYEEYVSAAFLKDRYLAVFYNSSNLYGVIIGEDGSVLTTVGQIAYTGLAHNDPNLSFMVVAGYNEWLVLYTSSDGNIYYVRVFPDGGKAGPYTLTAGNLRTCHGGAYSYGKYIVPFMDSSGQPSLAIMDATTWQAITFTLTTSGSFPLLVEGNRYLLVVWKDTGDDPNGNVYGRLVFPFNNSVSDVIDIGRDTGGVADDHIFAAYNYAEDIYVVTWSSQRGSDPDRRVYVATLSEAGSLGDVSVLDITSLTGHFYPHGVASGRDGKVYVTAKYYPDSQSDAYLVYGDLGTDVSLPTHYPVYTSLLDVFFLPDQGAEARNTLVELIASAHVNVSVAAFQLGYSTAYADKWVGGYIVEALIKAVYRLGPENVFFITDGGFTGYYEVQYLSYYIPIHSDSSPYYMHHKSIVVDNAYVVVSTANYDRYEFLSDRNILVIISNPQIAQLYTMEHKEMLSGVFHGGAPTPVTELTTLINGSLSKVWVYFSPDDYPSSKDTVRNLIQNAEESVYLMMYHFTDDDIAGDLIAAKDRGVDVKAIFEAGQYWDDKAVHDYDTLVDNGVLATLDKDNIDPNTGKWYPFFHVKAMVVDHQVVYIGSAQYTTNGFQCNDEHLLIINNTQLAQRIEEFFNQHWSAYTTKIVASATFTNGTPAAGVHVETTETWKTTTYTRSGVTGADGTATLYLVYPYVNISATGYTKTVTATYWGITATRTLTVSIGSSYAARFYLTGTSITVTGPTMVNIGQPVTYTVTLVNESTGSPVTLDTTVDLYVDGTYNQTISLTSGTGSFTLELNAIGTYTLSLYYAGEPDGAEIVLKSNTTLTVTVVKNATEIKIYAPSSVDENQSFTVTLKLIDGDDKPVAGETLDLYVKQGATVLHHLQGTTLSDGTVDITVPGLLGGTYTLGVVYNGSGGYEAANNSTTLTVRYGTRITLEAPASVEEDTVFYVYARLVTTATSTPVAGETMTLTVDGTAISVSNTTNATGWAMFKVSIPDPGSYSITVTYPGSSTYMESVAFASITVTPAYTTIETDIVIEGPATGKVYETLSYTVRLVDKNTRDTLAIDTSLDLYVNGTHVGTVALTSGTGSFTVKPGHAGQLNITLVYPGETIGTTVYTSSRNTTLVDISRRTTTLTITAPSTSYVWDEVTVTITLRDENGTALAGEPLTLYINGTPVALTTQSDGTATYTFKPSSLGPVSLRASYDGEPGVYLPATDTAFTDVEPRPSPTISASITTDKINETYFNLTITGTVKDAVNGTGLSGWIRVYIDKGEGWEYVGNTTVVNGTFTFTAVVDPISVRLDYVPPTGSAPYYSGGGASRLFRITGPLPAPEPPLLPLILLALLLLYIALRKRK